MTRSLSRRSGTRTFDVPALAALALASLAAATLPAVAVAGSGPGPSPDHVVVPTGTFPTDLTNVRAAVAAGGTVLLKALNSAAADRFIRLECRPGWEL